MSGKMPLHLRILLVDICAKNGRDLSFEKVEGDECLFDGNDREWLVDALVRELSATGLKLDDEPNERGLEIEALIDFIGPDSGAGLMNE
ncbi:hypothetical protein [Stenotrophomonas sp. Ker107b]